MKRRVKIRRFLTQESELAHAIRRFLRENPSYNRLMVIWDLDDTLYDQAAKTAFPGAVETVTVLANLGVRQAIYSMGSEKTRLERMELAGLPRDCFFAVFAIPWPMKTPKTWERHIAPYQADGAFVIYIGDSWVHDVAVGLGRADAVVYIQGNRKPGIMGTPDHPEEYPVWVVNSVADVLPLLPTILADPYQGREKSDYLGHYAVARAEWDAAWTKLKLEEQEDKKGRKHRKRRKGRKHRQKGTMARDFQLEHALHQLRYRFGADVPWEENEEEDPLIAPWDRALTEEAEFSFTDVMEGDDERFAAEDGKWHDEHALLSTPWPRTEWDRRDAQWAAETDDHVRLAAWERGEICGCGDDLILDSEREEGCCCTCKAMGRRTPRFLRDSHYQ